MEESNDKKIGANAEDTGEKSPSLPAYGLAEEILGKDDNGEVKHHSHSGGERVAGWNGASAAS